MVSASQALLFSFFILLVVTYETQGNDELLSQPCTVDRNCISPQMVCGAGICRCLRGHNPTEDNRNCIATTNGLCFDDSDCRSLQSSSCFKVDNLEGTCTCNEGYSSSEDTLRCLPGSNYQGSCEENVQCTTQLGISALCVEGRCECPVNYHFSLLDGRCIQAVGLLGSCVNSSQCMTSGSQNNVRCESGRCSCSPGFVQIQDSCRDGAQNVIVSGTVFLLYWFIKVFII